MTDIKLTDNQWTKIRNFLLQDPNAYVGKDEEACRRFVEAVKWVSRSGVYCPSHMGNGTRSISVSRVGARMECGTGCLTIL